jgi:hypothetical protein
MVRTATPTPRTSCWPPLALRWSPPRWRTLLLVSTPRPLVFFWWIVGLATVVVVLYPFSTAAPLSEKAATAAVDLVIGIVIGSLVSGVAERSTRVRQASEDTASYARDSSSRSRAYEDRDPPYS